MRASILLVLCLSTALSIRWNQPDVMDKHEYPGQMSSDKTKLEFGSFRDLIRFSIQNVASSVYSFMSGQKSQNLFLWEEMMADVQWNPELVEADPYGPYLFLPIFKSRLLPDASATHWDSQCFQSMSGSVTSFSKTGVTVVVTPTKKMSANCSDLYFFTTRKGGHFHEIVEPIPQTFQFNFTDPDGNDYDDVQHSGLQLYIWPLGAAGTIESLMKTLQLFSSDPGFQEFNVVWLQTVSPMFNGFQPRTQSPIIPNDSDIPDGTHLVITRLDGLDTMIMWGVGSMSGHHTIAFRDPTTGQLYVHESTDRPPEGDAYWPPPYGIIRTPFQQWVQQAIAADFVVDIIPLSKDYQAQFDRQKAYDFFQSVQGLPYGYHTFLYEWLDADVGNLPWKPEGPEILALLANFIGNYLGNGSMGAYSLILESLNNKLNTDFYTMDDMWRYFEQYGSGNVFNDFAAAVDIPELDSYVYSNPMEDCTNRTSCTGPSMVCDVFVANVYKHAGVFGSSPDGIQAAEFNPRDAYSINTYDNNWVGPAQCADTTTNYRGYCQILGTYNMPLEGFNSLPLYDHMNEVCTALPPDYTRTPYYC